MKAPGLPLDEAERLRVLYEHEILDTPPEPSFDALVELTAHLLRVPVALVSLIDSERQWFKACFGIDARQTTRALSFCGHVVECMEPMEVNDTLLDPRFADHPMVLGEPFLRFYAGQPLRTSEGLVLGTLCVVDYIPRELSEAERAWHQKLAQQVADQLDRRRRVMQLQRERASLQVLFDALGEGVVVQDKDGHISRWNPAAERILGLDGEQMAGRSSVDPRWRCFHRDGSPWPGEDHPSMKVLRTGQAVREEIMGVHKSDGETVWISINSHPIHAQGSDRVITTFHDITQRVVAEDERRSKLLDAILNSLPGSSLAIFDQGLCIQEHLWGASNADDLRGRISRITDWAPPEQQEAVREAATRCLSGAAARVDLFRGKQHLDLRLVPLPVERGMPPAGLALAYDLTEMDELRERVARQERLATAGTLAAGVGHEINNPLTFIVTNLEFALDELATLGGPSPPSWVSSLLDVLREALEGAARIGKIVRGLRAFAHEESSPGPTRIQSALDMALSMAMHEIRNRASLALKLDPVPMVLADESRLAQILVNLLVNAAQCFLAADPSANQIIVKTELTGDGRVALLVSDNGPGIPEDVLPRIFDPFFTTKPPGRGVGLGLSICSSIARSFGGELLCETAVGVGTTFRLLLTTQDASLSPAPPGVERRRAGRILVVDDEESLLKIFVRLLQADFDVVALADPRDALRRIASGERFDLIFCDLSMPHLGGIELFRNLSAQAPGQAERVIFMTGGILDEEERDFLGKVSNDLLEKPFNSRTIRHAIQHRLPAGRVA